MQIPNIQNVKAFHISYVWPIIYHMFNEKIDYNMI